MPRFRHERQGGLASLQDVECSNAPLSIEYLTNEGLLNLEERWRAVGIHVTNSPVRTRMLRWCGRGPQQCGPMPIAWLSNYSVYASSGTFLPRNPVQC